MHIHKCICVCVCVCVCIYFMLIKHISNAKLRKINHYYLESGKNLLLVTVSSSVFLGEMLNPLHFHFVCKHGKKGVAHGLSTMSPSLLGVKDLL